MVGRFTALLALGLVACDRCPPPEPVGGTSAARSEVRAAFDVFYEALGTNQICVTRLSMVERSTERDGHYNRSTRQIGVDWRAELGVTRVATHELCHALDHQHQIRWRDEALWTYDPPREDIEDAFHVGEAFADSCEVGPHSLQLVGAECPADTTGSEAHQLLQTWFPIPVQHGTTGLASEEWGSWSAHTDILRLNVQGSHQRVVRFDVDTPLEEQTVALNVDSGELSALALPYPTEAPPDLPDGWYPVAWATNTSGTLAVATLRATNGGQSTRLLFTDGTGTRSLGCANHLERPFVAGGELFTAWAEGSMVRWRRLTPMRVQGARPSRGG